MRPILPLKSRYIFSRNGFVRLRYMSGVLMMAILSAGIIHFAPQSFVRIDSMKAPHIGVEHTIKPTLNKRLAKSHDWFTSSPFSLSKSIRNAPEWMTKPEKDPMEQILTISDGDTVAGLLQKETDLTGKDVYRIVKLIDEHFDVAHVRPGHVLHVRYTPSDTQNGNGESSRVFSSVDMKLSPIKTISITRNQDDAEFSSDVQEETLTEKTYAQNTLIQTSLYGSAAKAGIPSEIVAKMIKIYSWGTDFQRDIRRGDKIEVMYTAYETKDGSYKKYGDIEYANIEVGGKQRPAYRYKTSRGAVDYFKPNGHSMKKTLMRTPVDGARISSGYGRRRHPVLGYTKVHKGVDFAAPTGTPIYAAGDGVVERANRFSSYGNYIRIRHNKKLKTAYAHLHRFAKGVRAGTSVKQGQIIGYIGTTGRSTGPHLHYEVLVNGTQVNPRRVDLPVGEQLTGQQLASFKAHMNKLNKQYASLAKSVSLAGLMSNKTVQ